jgi:hypothetical protein
MTTYRDVPGYPGYQAGSDGSIWSCWRFGGRGVGWLLTDCRRKQLRAQPVRSGHLKVTLLVNRRRLHRYVHALVLLAFAGPRPYPNWEARHRDGNPANNRPRNLLWGTRRDNQLDRAGHGTSLRGANNPNVRLTPGVLPDIIQQWCDGDSLQTIATRYRVAKATISGVLRGRAWGYVTGIPFSSRVIARDWLSRQKGR